MTGVEFLRHAKELFPDSVRIVFSGYTELESITDTVKEGKLVDENRPLSIEAQTVNQDLAATNRELSALLKRSRQQGSGRQA